MSDYNYLDAATPPTTEEEQIHCEMIKEAIKGMFINESRTDIFDYNSGFFYEESEGEE